MIDLETFNWGDIEPNMKQILTKEFFGDEKCIYEKFNSVKEGDIVFDVGSSCGPFSYIIKDRNIDKLFCIEPGLSLLEALRKNMEGIDYKVIDRAIGDNDNITNTHVYGNKHEHEDVKSIKFSTLIKEHDIKQIDFLKTDCEGGEYDIFNIENLCWLKENLKYCSGEWHLGGVEEKQKFREFRDVFLRVFPKHEVYSVNGINIKWDLWNEHFIQHYSNVIIYIDNR